MTLATAARGILASLQPKLTKAAKSGGHGGGRAAPDEQQVTNEDQSQQAEKKTKVPKRRLWLEQNMRALEQLRLEQKRLGQRQQIQKESWEAFAPYASFWMHALGLGKDFKNSNHQLNIPKLMKLARTIAASAGSASAKAEIKAEIADNSNSTGTLGPMDNAMTGRVAVLAGTPAQRIVDMTDNTSAAPESSANVADVIQEKEQNILSEQVMQQTIEKNPSELVAQDAKLSVNEIAENASLISSSNTDQQLQEHQQQDEEAVLDENAELKDVIWDKVNQELGWDEDVEDKNE